MPNTSKYDVLRIWFDVCVKNGYCDFEQWLTFTHPKETLEAIEAFKADERNTAAAIDVAIAYGQIDGAHHKMWVIDQIVRTLTNCPTVTKGALDSRGQPYTYETLGESEQYKQLITDTKAGLDGPDSYRWDTGIAP